MGEKHHHALVCDRALVEALSEHAARSIAQRDATALRAFWTTHARERRRASAGLTRPHEKEPEEPSDGELVARCLELCTVPGRDDDRGLGDRCAEAFLEGVELVPLRVVGEDDPPADLLERAIERFGECSTAIAYRLVAEDFDRFAHGLRSYVPPIWAHGPELRAAASRLEAFTASALATRRRPGDDFQGVARPEALARAMPRLRDALLFAADSGHAVVEWVIEL